MFALLLLFIVVYGYNGIYPYKNYSNPSLEFIILTLFIFTLFFLESCPIIDNIVFPKEKQFVSSMLFKTIKLSVFDVSINRNAVEYLEEISEITALLITKFNPLARGLM